MEIMTKRVIWSNDYESTKPEDWKESFEEWCEDNEFDTEEMDIDEYISDTLNLYLEDERTNLDVNVKGVILAFADLGLWNGRRCAIRYVGDNISQALYSNCDYVTWYCDDNDFRCDAIHHDGTNHYLFREVDVNLADDLIEDVYNGVVASEEDFIKRTTSVKPYIDKVYGW